MANEFQTSQGTVYLIDRKGTRAIPQLHPTDRRLNWAWGWDTAGKYLVDARLPPDDYRVTHAGAEWREVYDYLRFAYLTDRGENHDHEWGPMELARFTGNPHRKCQFPGCREVSLDLDDGIED